VIDSAASLQANGPPKLEVQASRHFATWLAGEHASLAVTTYQACKLFLIGTGGDARLAIFERSLPRCMGVASSPGALHVATLSQIWRFRELLAGQSAPAAAANRAHDAFYAPRRCWVTGDLDVHDLALLPDRTPVFANTLCSCLAAVAEDDSFVPLWQPRFISRLAAEDRCHLNGFALGEDGQPRYVTLVGASDVADGWREHRRSGGMVVDVTTSEPVVTGLSMPHSPRLHDGRLYVLNSGTGEFGRVDVAAGRFEPIAFCPGYLRGLAFLGGHALVGLSLPRENRTFTGLALDDALAARGAAPRCAIMAIDLATGDATHWLRLDGIVKELYDVAVLPGVRRPAAIGFLGDEIARMITIGTPPYKQA
jgi:uncharacterized protein (TIGR03032 family)